MPELTLLSLMLATLLAFLLGAGGVYLYLHRRLLALQTENVRLETELNAERRAGEERATAFEQARAQIRETFGALAGEALKHNSNEFLKLAKENLQGLQLQAKGELAQREKAIEGLVGPIREALEKTEKQIREIENGRQAAYGALTKHLESMAQAQQLLQSETRNLVQALRRPEVRGQWGEMTLRRLVELAGMVEHCDFTEQTTVQTTEGRLRPDMVIRLPDRRDVVVDAKTSLDGYLSAVEAKDDETRQKQLARHARSLRERVKELAAKAYWDQFSNAPDFVVLFIPGDQFLSAALDIDRELLEFALGNKVILATPTSFVALLRAVAFGWRQEALAENAEAIRKAGEELYGRLATFGEYLDKLGRSIESSVGNFNKAVGSFDSRVLPGARRFVEMGISAKKELEATAPVEKAVRSVSVD